MAGCERLWKNLKWSEFLTESEQNQNRLLSVNKCPKSQCISHAKLMCKILSKLHAYQLLK